jgi:hypothetical protein
MRHLLSCMVGSAISLTIGCAVTDEDEEPETGFVRSSLCTAPAYSALSWQHFTNPSRDSIYNGTTWIAMFTDDARTVRLRDLNGPRTISDTNPGGTISFTTDQRVLISPEEYDGTFDQGEEYVWLANELCAANNDIITRAAQYFNGDTEAMGADGLGPLYGDACYGQRASSTSTSCTSVGSNTIGADFYDYRGMEWPAGNPVPDSPDATRYRSLDCSGFVRMLFGWRGTGSPSQKLDLGRTSSSGLTPGSDPMGEFIPRTSYQMHDSLTTAGVRYTWDDDDSRFDPGDLVFYDTGNESPIEVTHVGIVVYNDRNGTVWVASSRMQDAETQDGPLLHALMYDDDVFDHVRRW